MLPVPVLKVLLALTTALIEMILIGIVVAWGWALVRFFRGRPLVPTPFGPLPPPTWGLGTLLTVMLLGLGAGLAAGQIGRDALGVDLRAILDRQGEARAQIDEEGPPTEDRRAEIRRQADSARQVMLVASLDKAIFLLVFPWVFRRVSGTSPVQLGFKPERWSEQIRAGFVAMLLALPVVQLIFFLARQVYPTNSHLVEQMLQVPFDPGLAVLALISTTLLAPLQEEILFRAILQGWLSKLFSPRHSVDQAISSGETAETVVAPDHSNRVCWPAVILSSLLFAAVHAPQWPAPIPLFAFSLVLGTLYQKTGSLWAAVSLHGAFNALSTLLMLSNQLGVSLESPFPPAWTFLPI